MRTAKKIIWVVLALLPILTFLFILLGQIGQQKISPLGVEGNDLLPVWNSVYIAEDINGFYTIINIAEGDDITTYTELALITFTGSNPYIPKESVMGAFVGLYNIIANEINIPATAPTFFGMLYLFYLAMLELVSLLIDFILFIPRKCGEIFR